MSTFLYKGKSNIEICRELKVKILENMLLLEPIPTMRDRYKLIHEFTKGGFKINYLAYDLKLTKFVIISFELHDGTILDRRQLNEKNILCYFSDCTDCECELDNREKYDFIINIIDCFIYEGKIQVDDTTRFSNKYQVAGSGFNSIPDSMLRSFGSDVDNDNYDTVIKRVSDVSFDESISIDTSLSKEIYICYVTPYYENGTIYDYYKKYKNISIFKKIAIQLYKAIKKLNINGIIHRDIKPANVLVDDESNIKLIDFGVSTFLNPTTKRRRSVLNTTNYSYVGTTIYMSPKALLTQNFDENSDVYAYGITMLQLYLGEFPEPLKEFSKKSEYPRMSSLMNYYEEKPIDAVLCYLLKDVTDLEVKTFFTHCLKTNINELEKILSIWESDKEGGKIKYYIDYGQKK